MRRPMTQACVSLDEVLLAAAARAASLVPETSGYLALAVADATSRLPYQHDDRAVLLTVDGSVMVPRKGAVAPPAEAGRGLRDLLRRLLAASTGSMPGLTSAGRPRSEEIDVDRVVMDIEAALIPVNRAAAKRAPRQAGARDAAREGARQAAEEALAGAVRGRFTARPPGSRSAAGAETAHGRAQRRPGPCAPKKRDLDGRAGARSPDGPARSPSAPPRVSRSPRVPRSPRVSRSRRPRW